MDGASYRQENEEIRNRVGPVLVRKLYTPPGGTAYLWARAMTFSKTRKKFPPQIFSISRSV